MTWKIEKKSLQGLDTWVVTSGNGVSRFASEVEVDMWTQILTLTKAKADICEALNKFGFKIEGILKAETGKGITDPDKLKSEAKKAEEKAKAEKEKAEKEAQEKEKAAKAVESVAKAKEDTAVGGSSFGKRPPEVTAKLEEKTPSIKDRLEAWKNRKAVTGPKGTLP